MRRAITALLVALFLIILVWLGAGLPGHVDAEIGRYSVAASTPVLLLLVVVLFFVLYLLLRLISAMLRVPRVFGRGRGNSKRRQGERAVTGALIALAAGNEAEARKQSTRARRLIGDTPQTLLLSAEAGRLGGRETEAAEAFRLLAERKDAAFLGLRGLMRQAMAREDWAEAVALARRAEAANPGAQWLRGERRELAVRTGAWAEALSLSDASAPKAVLATAAAEAEPDQTKALRLAKQAWTADQGLIPAAMAYATRLRTAGYEQRAQETVRAAWARNPHPDLAAFAVAGERTARGRAQLARRLAQENPNHPETNLMLARALLEAGMPGEARLQLETARRSGMNERRLFLLLADIDEAEHGDTEEGRMAQRDALRAAAVADADAGWRCEVCGNQTATWVPVCGKCGTLGRVAWGTGRAMSTLPVITDGAGEASAADLGRVDVERIEVGGIEAGRAG